MSSRSGQASLFQHHKAGLGCMKGLGGEVGVEGGAGTGGGAEARGRGGGGHRGEAAGCLEWLRRTSLATLLVLTGSGRRPRAPPDIGCGSAPQ